MSIIRNAAPHCGRATRQSSALCGSDDDALLSGSKRDGRVQSRSVAANAGQAALHRRIDQSARRTIMTQMNSVVHFEMPYDDRERMAKFYRDAFGWQTRMLGEQMGNYVIATTTETDESGPKRPGAINGGFFARKPDWPAQHPSLVIAVDNIQAAMKKVAEAGGKVLGEPIEIPGIGQYVSFVDTEDNRVSMLQPIRRD